ncbi:MAG: hypothetical protein II863_17625 [Kiritimatiellae bacterium]|nr:hypothetical protein [Kiritimatiellia bacterium]
MLPELAILTATKPFEGKTGDIQKRAFVNWRDVFGRPDIVEFDGPLVPFREMVEAVEHDVDGDWLMYANADVLFDKEQVWGLYRHWVGRLPVILKGDFLLTGQRVDILEDGTRKLHRPSGMDYFVFKRGMFHDLPRVLMGRAYCDNALVAYCLRRGVPVVDASFALRVEHQFHDYGHVVGGRKAVWEGDEAMANKRNNSLRNFGPDVLDATHTLLPDGRIVPNIRKRPRCWGLWNFLTRGGKWWKNPKWPGVEGI